MASTRRLAAIMFTDMADSTAAAQANEVEALKLRNEQETLVRPLFAAHQGHQVKSMGDGFLAEFDSALRATQCAIEIQRRIFERNSKEGAAPIKVRIGIHLGDVEQQGSDILGDAVNIASRIQPVAEPGGICVSNAVQEQVWNKISDKLEKLPPTALKGLRVPMDIYRVVLPWNVSQAQSVSSGLPRLAVLPLANISPDPKDEYFADGLTEELISALSQIRGLRVIARTSVSQYKATVKSIAQIGSELGVGSLLEGSVRKSGNRLRITLQLIDVPSQEHTWSESYDRDLDDVFAMQAAIARGVSESLKIRLLSQDREPRQDLPSTNQAAYALYLKGRVTLTRSDNEDDLNRALGLFREALTKDPWYAAPHVGIAECLHTMTDRGYNAGEKALNRARESADAALRLDPHSAEAYVEMASISIHECNWARAEREIREALNVNSNLAQAHLMAGQVLRLTGRLQESRVHALQALELDPLSASARREVASGYLVEGRWDDAISHLKNAIEITPERAGLHSKLAIAYTKKGLVAEGIEEIRSATALMGGRAPQIVADAAWVYSQAGRKDEVARILEELIGQVKGGGGLATVIAGVYAVSGDAEKAFEWLERARRDSAGITPVLLESVWFESVRDDPRFEEILRGMGLKPPAGMRT